jgi:predicted TIM-barrel fold metal-dependent hydrolase
MPLIDTLCFYGVRPDTLSARPPELAEAKAYADQYSVERMGFASLEAETDPVGGNARLAEAVKSDPRFHGWLTLSVHQPEVSLELARTYLARSKWFGARVVQDNEADAVDVAGGHTILNGLRRYIKPVLITANSAATLHAAVRAAREFNTLRFILAPEGENVTADAIQAIREVLNVMLLPSAAYLERDVLAQAVSTMSERRILWASEWGRLHPTAALGALREAALSNPQRERIGYRNINELLADVL